jgi:hypothetical protein
VKYHINVNTKNIVNNFKTDKTYFVTPNDFILKSIKIGPFNKEVSLNMKICDFIFNNISFENAKKYKEQITINGKKYFMFKLDINDDKKINTDIRVSIDGSNTGLQFWFNLWYSTLDQIKKEIEDFHSNHDLTQLEDKSKSHTKLEGKYINLFK